MPRKRRRKKPWALAIVEFAGAYLGVCAIRLMPPPVAKFFARRMGDLLYFALPRRRRIARSNLAVAFPEMRDERQIRGILRRSCQSLFLTFLEMINADKVFRTDQPAESLEKHFPGIMEKIEQFTRLYRETGGFVIVTAHLGNWENLVHFADVADIPTVVVARPLDNPLLHNMIYGMRHSSRQEFIGKHEAAYRLKKALAKGKCVALLADQRAMSNAWLVPFFGKPARTHRTPAMLAYHLNRPIVVVASCRTASGFDALASDPIWPNRSAPSKEDMYRMTAEVNDLLASFIRKYPDQYLWLHDRWKNA